MADLYSNHYNATVSLDAITSPRYATPPGISHAKIHTKIGTVLTTSSTATGDVMRMFTLKKGDYLLSLELSTVGDAGTSGTLDVGLYLANGGAVVDSDLFYANNLDFKAAIANVDVMVQGVVDDHDRGKQLWEISDEGASSYLSYAAAPDEFDVVLFVVAANTLTGAALVLTAKYTSHSS